MRPRLLDLFCGCGGCSVGYHRAGFEVVGVDMVRQPDYPYRFILSDALAYLRLTLCDPMRYGFHAIAASPPCKFRTVARHGGRAQEAMFDPHPDLLTPVLEMLQGQNRLPWVVENVPGPALDAPYVTTLCGSMFGLRVRRHRLFASSFPIEQPECRHAEQGPVVGVYGVGGADSNRAARGGGGGVKVVGAEAADALGIDWTTDQRRLSQAIPPAYTEFIGRQLLALLDGEGASPADARPSRHDTLHTSVPASAGASVLLRTSRTLASLAGPSHRLDDVGDEVVGFELGVAGEDQAVPLGLRGGGCDQVVEALELGEVGGGSGGEFGAGHVKDSTTNPADRQPQTLSAPSVPVEPRGAAG